MNDDYMQRLEAASKWDKERVRLLKLGPVREVDPIGHAKFQLGREFYRRLVLQARAGEMMHLTCADGPVSHLKLLCIRGVLIEHKMRDTKRANNYYTLKDAGFINYILEVLV